MIISSAPRRKSATVQPPRASPQIMTSVHPARLLFCAEHDLPSICDARRVTHVVSVGWPPPEDPTQVRKYAFCPEALD
jgi:hypothetical protein